MNNWPSQRIGSLCRKATVGFVGPMADLFEERGVPLLRGQNIKPGRIDLTNLKYISTRTHAKWSKSALFPGDVVIVRVGYPGTAAVVPNGLGSLNAASLVILGPDENKLSAKYLMYLINSPWGQASIRGRLVGVAQQVLNTKTVSDMEIPVPGLHTQKRIAEILSAYDDLIEVNTRRIKALEEMARRTYEECVARQAQGEVPLTEVAEITYGHPFKSKQFCDDHDATGVIRIRDVKGDSCSTRTHEAGKPKHVVDAGDVLVGMDGEFHTSIWAGDEAWLNQRVLRMRGRTDWSNALIYESICEPVAHLNRTIVGTTVAHLSARDMDQMQIPSFKSEVAGRLGQVLSGHHALSVSLRRENANLRAQRDLLLPRLISGEIDVSEAIRPEAMAAE